MKVFEADLGSVWLFPGEGDKLHFAVDFYEVDRLSCRNVTLIDKNGNLEIYMYTYSHWGCCYEPIDVINELKEDMED